MVRCVTFDLDGTLIDSTDAIVESFLHAFAVLGEAAPSRARIIETISVPLEAQFALLTDRDPKACVKAYREHYRRISVEKTFLLPAVRESLERLDSAGIAMGVATSKQREASEHLLRELGIARYFRFCLGPADVSHPKPHPAAVIKSLELHAAEPREMYFVGDTEFDVNAAHGAGVACLAVATGYRTREALLALKPAAVFDGMDEVADYILDGN